MEEGEAGLVRAVDEGGEGRGVEGLGAQSGFQRVEFTVGGECVEVGDGSRDVFGG